MITKTALKTDNLIPKTGKERTDNNMESVKSIDKFFNDQAMYMWVYSKGLLISTNNRVSRSFINEPVDNEWTDNQNTFNKTNFTIADN